MAVMSTLCYYCGFVVKTVMLLCLQSYYTCTKLNPAADIRTRGFRYKVWHINIIDRGYGKWTYFSHQPIQNAGSYAKVMFVISLI